MKKLLIAALLAAAATPAFAAPADVAAAVAVKARPAEAVKLDESRKPVPVLKFLGLKRGDRALDLFTGSGYYAEIIGKAVGPKGSVVAWEPASFYDDKGKKNWEELSSRVPNARVLVSTADGLTLTPNNFDFVLMHMVYHDTYWESAKYNFPRMDPAAFLAKVYAGTKPGGIVGIVDHVAESGGDTRAVADKLHRIDPAQARAEVEAAGCVFDGELKALANPDDPKTASVFDPAVRGATDQFAYRFRKP